MTKNLRLGVAGAGFIGAVHARAYRQVPGIELVGVADPVDEKAVALVHAVYNAAKQGRWVTV